MTHTVSWIGFAPADAFQETMWDEALSPAISRAVTVIHDAYKWGPDLQEDVNVLTVIGPSADPRLVVVCSRRSQGVRTLTVLVPTSRLPSREKRYILALRLQTEVLEVVADELGVEPPKLRMRMQPSCPEGV